ETGSNRADAVVAADSLVIDERAAADSERARIFDGAAGALRDSVAAFVAAGLGHVACEQTVGDAGCCVAEDAIDESAAYGIAGRVVAAAIGAQGQVVDECTPGDGQPTRTEIREAASEGGTDPAPHVSASIADGLVVAQDVVGQRQC